MLHKLYNPKSHSPAIYIACWLSQVPVKLLSHGAKLVYGRLSQWCNSNGVAFRSTKQLGQELGMCISSVEKYLKELRDVDLIGTYHPQAGGLNHFEFYDHPWMHELINKHLTYKSTDDDEGPDDHTDPPYNHTVPPVRSYGTPPYNHTDINIKENIINTTTSNCAEIEHPVDNSRLSSSSNNETILTKEHNEIAEHFSDYKKSEHRYFEQKQKDSSREAMMGRFREESLNDKDCIAVYTNRFKPMGISLEELYDDCCAYWSQRDQLVYKSRFLSHLMKAPSGKYKKTIPAGTSCLTPEESQAIQEYISLNKRRYGRIPDELICIVSSSKEKLHAGNTSINREMLALIANAEDINAGQQFSGLATAAIERVHLSAESKSAAREALREMRRTLGMLCLHDDRIPIA